MAYITIFFDGWEFNASKTLREAKLSICDKYEGISFNDLKEAYDEEEVVVVNGENGEVVSISEVFPDTTDCVDENGYIVGSL